MAVGSPHKSDLFRPLSDVLLPDPRHGAFSVLDFTTGQPRPISAADHHRQVDAMALGSKVPRDVRIAFDTARNVLMHAWFVYRFHQVAELQAISSVEMALRRRFDCEYVKKPPGLSWLLDRALAEGLIRGDGFHQYRRIVAGNTPLQRVLAQRSGAEASNLAVPDSVEYAKVVVKLLKDQRNRLAHGSDMLYAHSAFMIVAACGDLITQLYARRGESDGASQ